MTAIDHLCKRVFNSLAEALRGARAAGFSPSRGVMPAIVVDGHTYWPNELRTMSTHIWQWGKRWRAYHGGRVEEAH